MCVRSGSISLFFHLLELRRGSSAAMKEEGGVYIFGLETGETEFSYVRKYHICQCHAYPTP